MRAMKFLILLLSAGLFLLSISLVQAQEPQLSSEAQESMQRGLQAAKLQQWEMAVKYFKEAKNASPYAPEIIFNLALAYDKSSLKEFSAIAWYKAYLAAARPDAQNVAQVKKRVAELEIKLEALIRKLALEAKEIVAARDEYYRATVENLENSSEYRKITDILAAIGDIAEAKKTVALTANPKYKIDQWSAYSVLAIAQAKSGDINGALESVKSVKGGYIYYANGAIFTAMVKKGNLSQAKQKAADYKDNTLRSSAYCYIAQAQAVLGDVAAALETASLVEDIQGYQYKDGIYWDIALIQARVGDFDGALKTVKMANKESYLKDLQEIIKTYKKGEVFAWVQLAEEISSNAALSDWQNLGKREEEKDMFKYTSDFIQGVQNLSAALNSLREKEEEWKLNNSRLLR